MKDQIELKDITGKPVAGNAGTLVLTLPTNKRHNHVEIAALIAAARVTDAAQVGDVRFLYGIAGEAKIQRVATFEEINDYAILIDPRRFAIKNNDDVGGTSQTHFAFSQWDRKQYGAAERLALDVLPGRDAQIEIDYKDTAVAKTFTFLGYTEELRSIPDTARNLVTQRGILVPMLEKWYRTGKNANDTTVDIDDLPRKDVWSFLDLYNPAGAKIAAVEITKDSRLIFKRTKAQQDIDLIRQDLYPDDRRFTIFPGMTDNPLDDWNMNGSEELRIKVTLDQAPDANATIKVIRRALGTPD
jgi:hypothetical protein